VTTTLGAADRRDAIVAAPPPPAPTTAAAPPPRVEESAAAEKVAETVAEPAPATRGGEGAQLAVTPQRARAERAPAAAPARSAAEPTRDFAGVGAASAGPLRALEDCWRVTAPDSLAALYRDLTVLRQSGDTLVLVLPNAMLVTVVRRGDTLSGALTAMRVSCPLGSSITPRDSK
jgi:hypothetical protein